MESPPGGRRRSPVGHLCRVASLAALGRGPELEDALRAARAARVPLPALRETLLQVYLFAGFPRCVNALDAMERALGPLPPVSPERLPRSATRSRGRALFRRIYGDDTERVLARIGGQHREFRDWILDDAYGKVLGRPGLSAARRECIAVALLATLDLSRQQVAHVRGALRCGASRADVEDALAAVEDLAPPDAVAFARERLRSGRRRRR